MSPTIHFRSGTKRNGFNPNELSGASNDATEIVRELLQNSVDAAKEAEQEQTKIKFILEKIQTSELPGIDRIEQAFPCAVKTHKKYYRDNKLPAQESQTADKIKGALFSESIYVFSVLDNGIGLDERRMRAILDGFSDKPSDSGGAFGFGHLTTVASSDLRLIYYGGINEQKNSIASGHCFLANHQVETQEFFENDGYFINQFRPNDLFHYDFPVNDQIPTFINDKLNLIDTFGQHGTAVIVAGFNFFGEEKNELWSSIKNAAAANFFPSIHNGELVVEFMSQGVFDVLNEENLHESFEDTETNSKRTKFLSLANARNAFNVLLNGENIQFQTDSGDVEGKLLRDSKIRRSRVDLFRNGMWITNDLPSLSGFNKFEPFHLILLLSRSDGEIHRLVSAAEPPLHDAIKPAKLNKNDGQKLRAAFREIKKQLLQRIVEITSSSFQMDGILSLPIGGTAKGGNPNILSGDWEPYLKNTTPRSNHIKDTHNPNIGTNPNPTPRPTPNSIRKPGTNTSFTAIPVPDGPRSFSVDIYPEECLERAELRFILDESLDVTCQGANTEPLVFLKNVRIDGQVVDESVLQNDENGNIFSLLLDDISDTDNFIISFDFDLPDELRLPAEKPVALKAEMVRRKKDG